MRKECRIQFWRIPSTCQGESPWHMPLKALEIIQLIKAKALVWKLSSLINVPCPAPLSLSYLQTFLHTLWYHLAFVTFDIADLLTLILSPSRVRLPNGLGHNHRNKKTLPVGIACRSVFPLTRSQFESDCFDSTQGPCLIQLATPEIVIRGRIINKRVRSLPADIPAKSVKGVTGATRSRVCWSHVLMYLVVEWVGWLFFEFTILVYNVSRVIRKKEAKILVQVTRMKGGHTKLFDKIGF